MNKQDSISLFNSIYPDFFEREGICNLAEELIFEEMILPLGRFETRRILKKQWKRSIRLGYHISTEKTEFIAVMRTVKLQASVWWSILERIVSAVFRQR